MVVEGYGMWIGRRIAVWKRMKVENFVMYKVCTDFFSLNDLF